MHQSQDLNRSTQYPARRCSTDDTVVASSITYAACPLLQRRQQAPPLSTDGSDVRRAKPGPRRAGAAHPTRLAKAAPAPQVWESGLQIETLPETSRISLACALCNTWLVQNNSLLVKVVKVKLKVYVCLHRFPTTLTCHWARLFGDKIQIQKYRNTEI